MIEIFAAALVAQMTPEEGPGHSEAGDVIIVTGARSLERTSLTSPVPVDLLSHEALEHSSAVAKELGQAISVLAPSVNFPRQSNSGTSDHVRAAQLRGLSPDQVLVLVNGKRRHPSAVVNTETKIGRGTAAVDFNTIPIGAVKRVEVLRDGAGAIYGSDAVAGVINIVMDDAPEGIEIDAHYGLHHTDVDAIGQTLTDGETLVLSGEAGTGFEGGFLRGGVEYQDRNATNRAGFDQIPVFVSPTPDNLALRGERNYAEGDPATESISAWFNGERRFGATRLYAFGTASLRETEGATFFRYPDSGQNVKAIYPQGFLPVTLGDNEDFSATLGADRQAGAWRLDASGTYGRNDFTYGVANSLNASLGPDSPLSFTSGGYEFEQFTFNAEAARELTFGQLAPVDFVTGAEFRHERFQSKAGEPASYIAGPFDGAIGAQGAPGLTPQDERDINRDVGAVFAEAAWRPLTGLTIDAAGRYEHYDDFGDTLTGKLSGIYALTDAVSIRGAVSNNFRAPALTQAGFADRTVNFGENRTRVVTRTVPVDSPIARALGAGSLEPEESVNFSAGLVIAPFEALSLTVDAFHIEIDDRITLSERFFGPGIAAAVQGLPGGQGVESVRFFTNAIDTETQGVEIVADYSRQFAAGALSLNGAFSYADTEISSFRATPAPLRAINPAFRLVGLEEINTIQEAAPEWKAVTTAVWTASSYRLLARLNAYGETTRVFNFGGGFAPSQTYGEEIGVDTEASFFLSERVTFSVGANNVFDNYPDRSSADINFFGNLPYDILSPIGVNGRYLYQSGDQPVTIFNDAPTRRSLLAGAAALAAASPAGATVQQRFAETHSGEGAYDHSGWTGILRNWTRRGANGVVRVDYAGLKASPEAVNALGAYLAGLSRAAPLTLTGAEQFVFWVNAYNALTVQTVLEAYPVRSIRSIKPHPFALGPWGRKRMMVDGTALSLDDIEHGILRERWKDPRIHYAVNCASYSCPNLQRQAWTSEGLNAALDHAAAEYVNHPRGVSLLEDGLTVSSIYDWYAGDFGQNEAEIIEHFRSHAQPGLAAALAPRRTISGYVYDWSLNDTAMIDRQPE